MTFVENFRKFKQAAGFLTLLLMGLSSWALAQEGHPLQGTWSGDRTVNGQKVRVLLILNHMPDQSIEATLIENGSRIPVDVSLHHEDWSVTINVDGQTRSGEPLQYSANGSIENLGAVFGRTIVGTWGSGSESGAFQVTMN